jgi:hypothetical protein
MSFINKFILTKVPNFHYWKNNYMNNNNYSIFFFQFNLLKNIIYFFFIYSISNKLLKKKKIIKKLYISQIWINSLNNNLILSFNIYLQKITVNDKKLLDNYLRLKYFYFLIFKTIIV